MEEFKFIKEVDGGGEAYYTIFNMTDGRMYGTIEKADGDWVYFPWTAHSRMLTYTGLQGILTFMFSLKEGWE